MNGFMLRTARIGREDADREIAAPIQEFGIADRQCARRAGRAILDGHRKLTTGAFELNPDFVAGAAEADEISILILAIAGVHRELPVRSGLTLDDQTTADGQDQDASAIIE